MLVDIAAVVEIMPVHAELAGGMRLHLGMAAHCGLRGRLRARAKCGRLASRLDALGGEQRPQVSVLCGGMRRFLQDYGDDHLGLIHGRDI